jgi:hypothetical protein
VAVAADAKGELKAPAFPDPKRDWAAKILAEH